MIVFDLRCGHGHVFEAWFGSTTDYESQQARSLVSCPLCGDDTVEKAVMAPNVAAKGNRANAVAPAAPSPPAPEEVKAMISAIAEKQNALLAGSQWVGRDFADRARAMHHGEAEPATIHGQATGAEAKALAEEGVAVLPLPLPVVPPSASN